MNLAEDEADAIGQVRRFLSYLPSSVWEAPPEVTPDDDPDRRAGSLLSVVPQDRRRTYDPYEIVGAVVDKGLPGLRWAGRSDGRVSPPQERQSRRDTCAAA